MNKQTLKRYFIIAIITTLVAGALLGIVSILVGGFSWVELRIVATTLAVGVFSITSLANLRNLDSEHRSYRDFAKLSILFSFVALLFILSFIWISTDTPWRPTLIFFVLAVSTSHASLLLPARLKSRVLDLIVTSTLACIVFVAGCLIYLVIAAADVNGIVYRLLAVFAILDVLGTIVVPILARYSSSLVAKPASDTTVPLTDTPKDTDLEIKM